MQKSDPDMTSLVKKRHPDFVKKSVALRLSFYTAITLIIVLCLYYLATLTGKNDAVGMTVIIAIPVFIGAFIAYLSELYATGSAYKSAAFVGISVFTLGVIFLKEAVICVLMLAAIWWPLVFLGAFIVRVLFINAESRGQLYTINLLALPIFTLIIDATVPMPIENRAVTRDILIHAPVSLVWEQLHDIPDIQATEGRWNITHDLLGIPRPIKAETRDASPYPIRTNYWSKSIKFEEHIIEARPHESLQWEFIFPDDSLKHKTDPHLDPSSHYFHIDTGGFNLSAIDSKTTRLTLQTRYIMQTPVNGYSALWGEFFLGDIQNNALETIKTRIEMKVK